MSSELLCRAQGEMRGTYDKQGILAIHKSV